ncbi:MAG TPA: hypothetical protein VH723_08995 [Candidatus Limnocylindrales bacterium]
MPRADGLAALARPSGAFAMVALDQRESLRTMLGAASPGRRVADRDLTDFKVAAARALTPHASAVLLDVDFGLAPARRAGAITAGCGLIVAADRLVQERGGLVEDTDVDDAVLADDAIAAVADAYKLLVIWRRDGAHADRNRVVERFLDACRRRGRPGVVEGVVRIEPGDDHPAAVLDAARELAGHGPDLYKAEVPTLGRADEAAIARASERITAALDCPWVVLSNGVDPERFDDAAGAACRGGASGFLAGRAIWTASLAAADVERHLVDVAAPRLRRLAESIDRVARPWQAASTPRAAS